MSIDNIQLSSFVVGEWYKDALVASPDAPPPAAAHTPAAQTAQPPAPQPAPPASARPIQPPATHPPEEPKTHKILGNNRRHITIVVHSPGIPFLPDNQLAFLTKILEACQLNIGDVAIVNAAAAPVQIAALRLQLQPSSILLFGIEPAAIRLPINFPVFRLQPYDRCTYLSAPALDQLVEQSEESRLLKSKLWVCLKTLFNV